MGWPLGLRTRSCFINAKLFYGWASPEYWLHQSSLRWDPLVRILLSARFPGLVTKNNAESLDTEYFQTNTEPFFLRYLSHRKLSIGGRK